MNLKETCQQTDTEWEERQKARQEEIQACSQALAILSNDDAHDTFTKTFNFVQVAEKRDGATRDRAAALLRKTAQELKARDIDDLTAEIAQLTSSIDELAQSISGLQAAVADQRETQKLLTSALNVLKAVYAKKFLQTG